MGTAGDTPVVGTPATTAASIAAAPGAAAALPYDRSGGTVSVRGFRLLVVLTLVNTALLASTVLGPQLFPFARQQVQAFKKWRAERQRLAARLAAEGVCRNHLVAADRVVYEEDPGQATKYLNSSPTLYETTPPTGNGVIPGWVAPAHMVFPSYYSQYVGDSSGRSTSYGNYPLLFLHERSTPAGEKFLVAVHLHSQSAFMRNSESERPGRGNVFRFYQSKERTIFASRSAVGGGGPGAEQSVELKLSLPDEDSRAVATLEAGQSLDAPPVIDYGNVLRFYAGQPDPDDASHFTIAYVLDGRAGTIDGWLRNDGLELRPRDGARAYDKKGVDAWKLPTTRPTGTD